LIIGAVTGATGTTLNVQGSTGQLFSVTDVQTGVIYQVGDISGVPILQVNSNGGVYITSSTQLSVTSNTTIYSFPQSGATAGYFDYRVNNTVTGAYRAGTVTAVWNGTIVEFTDTSTADLVASTAGISFTVTISGSNLILTAVITTGTWNVKVGARLL
jgi:hypothetical protein